MKKAKSKSEVIHEGEKLSELIDYLDMTRESFCLRIGISSAWLRRIVKRNVIPQKNKLLIFREFNIAKDYWTGKYELPTKKEMTSPVKIQNKPGSDFGMKDLQECKNLLLEKDKMIIGLQQRIIELMERVNG